MTQKLNDVEQWITTALNNFSNDFFKQKNRSSSSCTHAIKKIIGDYGREKGFVVCTSGLHSPFESEWLFDMVWCKNDKDGNIVSIELVLESEMQYGLDAIKYDYQKLLLANSTNRIMICCAGNNSIDEIKNYCDKAVAAYTQLNKGDRILTLIWDDCDSGEFIPHVSMKE